LAAAGIAWTAAVRAAWLTIRRRRHWPLRRCWTADGSTHGGPTCRLSSRSTTRRAAPNWPPWSDNRRQRARSHIVRMPRAAAAGMWKTRWPPPHVSPAGNRCPTLSWRSWAARWPTVRCATCSMPLPLEKMPVTSSRCGRFWRAPCPSRGGLRRWCCSRSAPMPAGTGRWPGCRWRRRCAATRATGWRACWTPHCNLACGPSTFVNSRTPVTGLRTVSVCGYRRAARSAGGVGRGVGQTFSTLTACAISCGRVTFS